MMWKIVPVRPTEDMLAANHCECGDAKERDGYIVTDYRSMLSASPDPLDDDDLVSRIAAILTVIDPDTDHMRDAARAVLRVLNNG